MTIETKYNIGDVAWAMWRGIPFVFEISKVIIIHSYKGTIIQYKVRGCNYFFEPMLFPTKEELLKSL